MSEAVNSPQTESSMVSEILNPGEPMTLRRVNDLTILVGRVCSDLFSDSCKIDPAILNASSGNSEAHRTSQHDSSVTPGPSSRPNHGRKQQSIKPSPAQQPRSRKRPFSAVEEANYRDKETLRPSFGYLTNQGKHRCALCKTELSSAEMLRKHESLSELHLTNLRDPVVVSKGWMTLSSVTDGVSESAPRLAKIPVLAAPSQKTLADAPNDVVADACCTNRRKETSSTPFHDRSRSTVARNDDIDMSDTIIVASGPCRGESQHPPRQPRLEDVDSAGGDESRPDLNPDIGVVQQSPGIDQGKLRAQAVPNDDRSKAALPTVSQPQPQSQSWQSRASTEQQGVDKESALPSIQQLLAGDLGAANNIPPTMLVQALLSSGMELLVKKCIEEHPELNADFYNSVKGMQQGLGRVTGGKD